MRFNQVTWYSKLAALALFVALPFLGFWVGLEYQKAITVKETPATGSTKIPASKEKLTVKNEQLEMKVVFQENKLKFSGTVQLPTPCHNLTAESTVAESYPEQVTLYLNTIEPRSGGICAQVITPKDFSGELNVSENASIKVVLNGKVVK